MEIVEMAEVLLVLLTNGIRFYACWKYMDFFVPREKNRWRHSWLLYILGCLVTGMVAIVFVSPNLNVVVNILALFLLTLPYEIRLSKRLLMTLSIYAVNMVADMVIVQLFVGYERGRPIGVGYHLIIALAILIPTVFLKDFRNREKDTPLPMITMVVLCLIPLFSIVCLICVASLTDDNRPVVLAVSFCMAIINALVYYLYHALTKFYAARMNEKRLEQMVDVYAHQLDVMQESQARIRKLRHDMKHHVIELSAMAQHGENTDMVQYLDHMKEFMLNPAEKVSTGNKEIDGILNYMLRRADEALRTVDIDIRIPERLYNRDFKICAILGNLIDNAIRAAGQSDEKYLSVRMQTQIGILLILIENSYDGLVVREGEKLKTTQADASVHGVGLESVKQIVASCGGDIKIEYTDSRFRVQVLLYLEDAA